MAFNTKHVISADDIRVGSRVVIRSGFGQEKPETVILAGIEPYGKNGYDTVDYVDSKGQGRWAYLDQVVEILKY